MNETFLMQDPTVVFDDFMKIPHEAFEHVQDLNEIVSLLDTVLENEDFGRVLSGLHENNADAFKQASKKIQEYLKEVENGEHGSQDHPKAKYAKYFLERTKTNIEEISKYGGVFPKVKIRVSKVEPDAILPKYQDGGDAGADVYASKDMTIMPGETAIVPTGVKVIVPGGYQIEIRPRSGISSKTKVRIPNAPGTIDSGYRGEVGVIMENLGTEPYHITKHSRIAQMVLQKAPKIVWEEIPEDEFKKYSTERGPGYGSSGV